MYGVLISQPVSRYHKRINRAIRLERQRQNETYHGMIYPCEHLDEYPTAPRALKRVFRRVNEQYRSHQAAVLRTHALMFPKRSRRNG